MIPVLAWFMIANCTPDVNAKFERIVLQGTVRTTGSFKDRKACVATIPKEKEKVSYKDGTLVKGCHFVCLKDD